MSFGNRIGAVVNLAEQELFDYAYGSIVVEAAEELDFADAILIGETIDEAEVEFCGERFHIDELQKINSQKFCQVYPDRGLEGGATRKSEPEKRTIKYKGEPVKEVKVYIPVFPGTNCDPPEFPNDHCKCQYSRNVDVLLL